MLGSAIVAGHTTLFLDVYKVVELYSPEWFGGYNKEASYNIILAEDSTFYRNMIKSYLSANGYNVVTAKDGNDAWEKLVEYGNFDILITDIVMPNMDGFELSTRVREDDRFSQIPIITISSYMDSNNEDEAKKIQELGIDRSISKSEPEKLPQAIEDILEKRLKKAA